MKRRRFIQRCAVGGVAFAFGGRDAPGASSQATGRSADAKSSGVSVPGRDGSLSYFGSFATPTITDTWPKPPKTARINFGKHTKLAYCPANGLIYICGGDGQGQHFGGNDSGTIDTVGVYDVTTHIYKEDVLYRGYVGEPVPRGLDFVAFTWAPSLREFWLGPGYCWNYTTAKYPWVDTSWHSSNYASYNPVTRRFTDRGRIKPGAHGEGFAGSWDIKRDRLVCSFEPVILGAHGGDLNGFILVKGVEEQKLRVVPLML